MKTAVALLLLAALLEAARAHGAPTPATTTHAALRVIEVRGPRVHAKDILGASTPDASVDLGATPPIGSSKILDRAEIERAFAAANLAPPKNIPAAVRVARKTRKLGALELNSAIRTA